MTEVVGNLVVTDLQKYLLSSSIVPEVSKNVTYDFNRVRRSVIDAYEATLTSKDPNLGKKKLVQFENEAGQDRESSDSQVAIINRDAIDNEDKDEPAGSESNSQAQLDSPTLDENRPLTTLEKLKRYEMEKTAGWWSKYYASKAKLVIAFPCSLLSPSDWLLVEISSTIETGHGRRDERQLRCLCRVLRR